MAGLISHGSPQGAGVVYLVEEQCNPSTDYFVLPAVSASGCRVVRCGFADLPSAASLDDASVVFVRYVPPAWAKLVEAVRPRLRTLAFFMDDDVLEVGASAGLPWRYRFKLARLAAWRSLAATAGGGVVGVDTLSAAEICGLASPAGIALACDGLH